MAGKLCPFAFPKAARNSRSQFSISADFSIRLRGAASHRARAPTRRLLHGESIPSSPPLRKKRKREKRRREKRGALPSLAGSPVHGASRTPSRIEERESSSRRAPDRPSLQNRDGTPSRRNWFVANRLGFPRERRGKERRAYSFAFHRWILSILHAPRGFLLPLSHCLGIDRSAFEKEPSSPVLWEILEGVGGAEKNTLNRRHVGAGDSSSGREIGQGSNR